MTMTAADLELADIMASIWSAYPERDMPHPYVATRHEVKALLKQGIERRRLINAAARYAKQCVFDKIEPKFRIGPVRFFRDGIWQKFDVAVVEGRTREEWARSGQDLDLFDTQAAR